jgi:hypothetical protein
MTTDKKQAQLTGGGAKENRRALDYYPTPPDCIIALMEFLKLEPCTIWEPACGQGHMSKVLKSYGHEVFESDIADGLDFFELDYVVDAIITNPPFMIAEEFIKKSLTDAPIVAMLLKSQYWHAKSRTPLFKKYPPSYVLPLNWRPDFYEDIRKEGDKKGSSTMEMAWTVWIKGDTLTKYNILEKPSK